MSIINLVNIKKYYTNLPHQTEAIEWLGGLLLNTAIKDRFKLVNNSDWVKLQDEQLTWLQAQISEGTLHRLAEIWRNDTDIFAVQPLHQRAMTDQIIRVTAKRIGVEYAALKAFVMVESNGVGFHADGRPRILFEAHIFSKYSNHRFDSTHGGVSSRRWNRRLYRGGYAEWDRLAYAMKLDEDAALMSFSMGFFQVCTFNWRVCGYSSVQDFIQDNHTVEGQLKSVCNFLIANNIINDLKRRDWHSVARKYNGSGYRQNNYHTKLANAYNRYK